MKILNIEDTATKHAEICIVLRRFGITDIDWAKNLEDGIELLKKHSKDYGLVITDMYYPLNQGGPDIKAGEMLIQRMKDLQLSIPIILCSSVRYRIPEILGTVYYSKSFDWERELQELIKSVRG